MFVVIAFIFAGIFVGYMLRRRDTEVLSKAITVLVWTLLFLMGVEVGGNDDVMLALPTLGIEALVIALLSVMGSCLAAWTLWKWTNRKGGCSR